MKKDRKISISISLKPTMVEEIDKRASKKLQSRSEYIEGLITKGLDLID